MWQNKGGIEEEVFLFCANNRSWMISDKEDMEAGAATGWASNDTTGLTPDQAAVGKWRHGEDLMPQLRVRCRK